MPNKITNYNVFVASPSDIIEERKVIREVIDDLNFFLEGYEYRLELVDEEKCSPGMGRAQGIINSLIDKCDIFIGIMGKKYGSPTGQYESGTVEEFYHAYILWTKNGAPDILFYFKNVTDIVSSNDEQYKKISTFKENVKQFGYVKEYSDISKFKKQISTHLRDYVMEEIKKDSKNRIPDDKVESYIELLKDPSPDVRKRVADLLGKAKDSKAVMPLIDLLNDFNIEVKCQAIDALGEIGDKRALKLLLSYSNDANSIIKRKARDSIKKIDNAAVFGDILKVYTAKESDINQRETILPNLSIKVMPYIKTILVGGAKTIVTAQLFTDQKPLVLSGIPVTFSTDTPEIVALHKNTTYITDENGRVQILLTTYNNPGLAKISASAVINNLLISGETEVNVVLWGAITGVIYDQNNVGIPNANVILWHYNKNSYGAIERTSVVEIPENPQLANDGRTAQVGRYRYGRVPSGDYCITGEKDGHVYYALIHLDQGTVTQDVIIPEYSYFIPTR